MFRSDDVLMVRTYEIGDHIRDQRTRQIHSGRAQEVSGEGFGGERPAEPSHQVGSNREPSGKVRVRCLIQSSDTPMTAKNVGVCGLVVSLALSQLLLLRSDAHFIPGTRGALRTS
jgi:hypothetical protein